AIGGCESNTTLCSQLSREELNQTDISICSCYEFGDPRSSCSSSTQDCELASQSNLNDVSIGACSCYSVGDPRNECSQSKSCDDSEADLNNVPEIRCECNGDDDPRRGTICAVSRICESNDFVWTACLCSEGLSSGNCTCTEEYHNDQQCICDQSGKSEVYDLSTCLSTKICTDNNIPSGCTCPTISETAIGGCESNTTLCSQLSREELNQTDISICSCYEFGDPRSSCSS
ncbi:MAG: hypothetical protein EZS28_054457, partial [Streblomastix strix]